MISPSPTQVGHTDTYRQRKDRSCSRARKLVILSKQCLVITIMRGIMLKAENIKSNTTIYASFLAIYPSFCPNNFAIIVIGIYHNNVLLTIFHLTLLLVQINTPISQNTKITGHPSVICIKPMPAIITSKQPKEIVQRQLTTRIQQTFD